MKCSFYDRLQKKIKSLLTNVYVEDEVRSSHMVGTLEEHVFDLYQPLQNTRSTNLIKRKSDKER
jgi:hypothetical protein